MRTLTHYKLQIDKVIWNSIVITDNPIVDETSLEVALFWQIVNIEVVEFWVLEKPFKLLCFIKSSGIRRPVCCHIKTYIWGGYSERNWYLRSKLWPSGLIPSDMAYLIPVKMPIEMIGSKTMKIAKPAFRLRVKKFFLSSTLKCVKLTIKDIN